ncbi:uncharacterized protein [Dendrobates tinctorius]|uniref:uncharacterized protein isoform X2 n=1 Tax=Dendrobates tinctorius TaxID=92724 RepID=UPI003CC9511E
MDPRFRRKEVPETSGRPPLFIRLILILYLAQPEVILQGTITHEEAFSIKRQNTYPSQGKWPQDTTFFPSINNSMP